MSGGLLVVVKWRNRIGSGERVEFTFLVERGKVGSGSGGRGVVVCSEIVRLSTLAFGEVYVCEILMFCVISLKVYMYLYV